MTKWHRDGNRWLRHRIEPEPRTFYEQVRDECYTIVAWAILAGVVILLVIAWGWGT